MNAHDIWRAKTDDEVLAAYAQLDDYTDEGRQILRSELERRQLTPLAPQESAALNSANTRPDPLPDNPLARLWVGGYSLPQAYWGWYWGGSFAWRLVRAFGPPATPDSAASARTFFSIWLLATLSYLVVAAIGVWRSAGFYRGRPAWAALARVAVAAGVSLFIMQLIYVQFGPR